MDEETWPHCGHPKTEANTRRVGVGRTACKACRTKIDARRSRNRNDARRRKEPPK